MYVENIVIACLLVLTGYLFVVAGRAYYRTESGRMALMACGFLFFFTKAALLAGYLFNGFIPARWLLITIVFLDTAALSMIYLGVLTR